MRQEEILAQDVIAVRVRPGAGKTLIESIEGDILRIALKSQPEGGKANAELERFLTRLTGKIARVIAGRTSRRKMVRLADGQGQNAQNP